MGIGWFGKVEKQSTARPRHNRHIIVTSCCCFSVLSWILPRLIAPCAWCPLLSHRPVKSHTRPLFQSNPSSTHQSKNVSFITLNLLLTQQRFKVAKWCNLCGNLFIHNFRVVRKYENPIFSPESFYPHLKTADVEEN